MKGRGIGSVTEEAASLHRVLVTGAGGQIGTELVPALRLAYGEGEVLATDIREPSEALRGAGPFQPLDCTDPAALATVVRTHRPRVVFHLAALLSAVSERVPHDAYRVNLGGLMNLLEAARESGFAVFHPSSIAVFGPGVPDPVPQDTIQRPTTIYGVTKVAGELLCDYYHQKLEVDARGIRYPGLISHSSPAGGGSTDYAVDIFHAAVREGRFTCPLRSDTRLDMIYMPDAVRAAMELMEADEGRLRHRNAFNLTAMQITPGELAEIIRRRIPLEVRYEVDPVRQEIADSWPRRVDDSEARAQWGWRPVYDVEKMVTDMLHHLTGAPPNPR